MAGGDHSGSFATSCEKSDAGKGKTCQTIGKKGHEMTIGHGTVVRKTALLTNMPPILYRTYADLYLSLATPSSRRDEILLDAETRVV